MKIPLPITYNTHRKGRTSDVDYGGVGGMGTPPSYQAWLEDHFDV